MTPNELESRQLAMEAEIEELTKRLGLATDQIEPIYDGIADCTAYLSSSPRVAWILKEPYDSFDDYGKPADGGWSIPRDCFLKSQKWPVLTWQRVIYIMYGLKHGQHYAEMDYIRDNPEMGDVLKEIVWLNVSKMPAYSTSSYTFADAYHNYWRPILLKQIALYDPEVIVFGNTFSVCKQDIIPTKINPIDSVFNKSRCFINVFRHERRILLDVYHPGIRSNTEFYVDSIIDAIQKHYNKK